LATFDTFNLPAICRKLNCLHHPSSVHERVDAVLGLDVPAHGLRIDGGDAAARATFETMLAVLAQDVLLRLPGWKTKQRPRTELAEARARTGQKLQLASGNARQGWCYNLDLLLDEGGDRGRFFLSRRKKIFSVFVLLGIFVFLGLR